MTDSDKIKMPLNIGSQRITVTVPFSRQDFIREIEKDVNALYSRWHKQFPNKTDRELLAMVAYQYALFYKELYQRYQSAEAKAQECIDILADTQPAEE